MSDKSINQILRSSSSRNKSKKLMHAISMLPTTAAKIQNYKGTKWKIKHKKVFKYLMGFRG